MKHEYLIPIEAYIRQLQQEASNLEWDGELERCDVVLQELATVRQYQVETGSFYYPLH